MFRFGIGVASPSISLSTPAMILMSVDLPEPLRPSTPIFAPGKNESEMSFRIWRFGGTILPTRFMVKTYWAMGFKSDVEAALRSIWRARRWVKWGGAVAQARRFGALARWRGARSSDRYCTSGPRIRVAPSGTRPDFACTDE